MLWLIHLIPVLAATEEGTKDDSIRDPETGVSVSAFKISLEVLQKKLKGHGVPGRGLLVLWPAHRCFLKVNGGESVNVLLDPFHADTKQLYIWEGHHERLQFQLGVTGNCAVLHLVSHHWCYGCCEHRTRRSWKKSEKRRKWQQPWRCRKEAEASPHPTWTVQLHLHPARTGWMPG